MSPIHLGHNVLSLDVRVFRFVLQGSGVCVCRYVCALAYKLFLGGAPCKVGFKFNGILLCVSTDMASGVNSLAFNTSGIRPIDPTAVAAHHAQWVKQTIH